MNVKELKAELDKREISYDPKALKPALEALLPKEEAAPAAPAALPEAKQEVANSSGDSRANRWKKFLVAAKVQNPVKFALKEDRGDFKKIPDSFR